MLAGMMKAAPNLGTTGEYLVHCFGRYEFAGITPKLPDVTFNGRLERRVGRKTVELIEVGPAHTGGDTLAYVAKDKTIFTGDILFIHGHPIIWAGPVANWIAACRLILDLDVETVVPGHGPVTDKAGVKRVARLSRLHRPRSEGALRCGPWRVRSRALHCLRRLCRLGRRRTHRRQRRHALPRIRRERRAVGSSNIVRLDGADCGKTGETHEPHRLRASAQSLCAESEDRARRKRRRLRNQDAGRHRHGPDRIGIS